MFKKTSFKTIVGSVVLGMLFIFGATLNVNAGTSGIEPGDLILKGGKIVGVLSGVFSGGTLHDVRFVGSLYKPSGTKAVALNPIATFVISGNPSEADFLSATEEHLENWQLEGIGPPNVFSESGGETLIITRVKEVFVAKSSGGTVILGAIITVRARAN